MRLGPRGILTDEELSRVLGLSTSDVRGLTSTLYNDAALVALHGGRCPCGPSWIGSARDMAEPHENSVRDVSPVRIVAWELTRACNLACFYCRASAGNFDPMEMPAADAMNTLDEIARLGRPLLILTGGEPFLREDLFEITERAVGMGFPVAVASNGTLISAEAASRLSDCGVHRVSVSLDFPEARAHDRVRGGGSFEAAMAGITNLVRAGVALQVNMTVTSANANEIHKLVELAADLGAVAFHLFFLVDVGRAAPLNAGLSAENYESILADVARMEQTAPVEMKVTCAPQYNRIRREMGLTPPRGRPESPGCMAGRGFFFISALGEAKPCGYFDYVLGKVREVRLDEMWADHPVLNALRDPATFHGKCGICKYGDVCGGCRARALAATGDFLSDDPACLYNF